MLRVGVLWGGGFWHVSPVLAGVAGTSDIPVTVLGVTVLMLPALTA